MSIEVKNFKTPILSIANFVPTAEDQEHYPLEGTDGYYVIGINGDSNLIQANIKSRVKIFGITGTYSGVKQERIFYSDFSVTSYKKGTTTTPAIKITLPSYITFNNIQAGFLSVSLLSSSTNQVTGHFQFPRGEYNLTKKGTTYYFYDVRELYVRGTGIQTWFNTLTYSDGSIYLTSNDFSTSWTINANNEKNYCVLFYS